MGLNIPHLVIVLLNAGYCRRFLTGLVISFIITPPPSSCKNTKITLLEASSFANSKCQPTRYKLHTPFIPQKRRIKSKHYCHLESKSGKNLVEPLRVPLKLITNVLLLARKKEKRNQKSGYRVTIRMTKAQYLQDLHNLRLYTPS